MVKSRLDCQDRILALSLASCVSQLELSNFSMLQFPSLIGASY